MDVRQIANSIASSLTTPINYGSNVNDGGGNASVTANIRNLGSLTGLGKISARATDALGAGANQQAQNEDEQRKVAQAQAEAEAQAKASEIKRLSDPKNYKAVINDKGGYDFFNPNGDKISPVDYAKATNQHITDLYKKSQDPNDKDFTSDYNRVVELGRIFQSGDKDARDKFFKKNPEWKTFENATYNQIVQTMRDEYPGYFRSQQDSASTNFGNSTFSNQSTVDNRSTQQKLVDQLMPSFLGNKSTYKRRV